MNITLDANGDYISNHKVTSFHNKIVATNENKMLFGGFENFGSFNDSNFIFAKLDLDDNFDCDTIYEYSIEDGEQSILEADSITFSSYSGFTTQNISIIKTAISIDQQNYCDILLINKEPIPMESHIIIYPNPTQDYVKIESEFTIDDIDLYDAYGRFILNSTNGSIDLSKLTKGVYFLHINVNGENITKEIIKN